VRYRDGASFAAGQDTGTRLSACVARLAAAQLLEESRWWNRWRRRLMARALVTCAAEMEEQADARKAACAAELEPLAVPQGVRPHDPLGGPRWAPSRVD
jgi:hypothetical protein